VYSDRFNQLNAIITAQREELDRQRVLIYELNLRIETLVRNVKGDLYGPSQCQDRNDQSRVA
jgi:hypothetical protein